MLLYAHKKTKNRESCGCLFNRQRGLTLPTLAASDAYQTLGCVFFAMSRVSLVLSAEDLKQSKSRNSHVKKQA
jgi:hypothetical protein